MKYLTLALATLLLFGAVLVLSERVVSLEARVSAHESAAIDSKTLVIQRWETADGTEVMPPRLVPLWSYVQSSDNAIASDALAFQHAFEVDLNVHDLTFHRTHEVIDGKEW